MTTKNKILGIVGRQGSGKSTLARLLADTYFDYEYIDIDYVVGCLYARTEVNYELFKHFGIEIGTWNKTKTDVIVDTKKLGKIVFEDENELNWLNNYIYPFIEKELNWILLTKRDKLIIIDWALLPATPLIKKCDLIWNLKVPYEVRKERVIKRDNITEEYFDKRELKYPDFKYDVDCEIIDFNEKEIEDLKYSIMNGGRVRI